MSATLRVTDLRRDYGQGPVLDGLSFCLNAGDTLSVIGPSGCGKSTLLTLLAGLDRPDGGAVRLEDARPEDICLEDVCPGDADGRRRGGPARRVRPEARAAVIFQDYGLFPWKTVEANVGLPLRLAGVARAARRQRVAAALAEMGLSGLERRYPPQLSGGQRQRVAIARALITRPGLLLMDEPFSALDALTRARLHGTLLELWRRHRPTCVLVTHSVDEAVLLGRHILVLSALPARAAAWIDNPGFGAPDAASRLDFFELTRRVQAALAGGNARAAGASPASGRERPCAR